jgi:GDP-L-fucose synthase
MKLDSKIYVAGHRGMVGSAIVRNLKSKGYTNIIYRTSKELDLRIQSDTEIFFEKEKPEYVFLAAAKVGGINANDTYPAEFIYDNLMIASNIIHSAYKYSVKKLIALGSSCIYPKFSEQPIKEESLMNGELEPTNEAYAIAKIIAIELCKFYRREYNCDFISAMPTSLFGINDNFDLETGHVIQSLMRKFHEAKIRGDKEIVMWGTGKPKREFLYVDDLADCLVYLMLNYSDESHVNIGTGKDIEIRKLAEIIKQIVGYEGEIINDTTKPDGTPRKVLDIEVLNKTNWRPKINLENGLKIMYQWYLNRLEN